MSILNTMSLYIVKIFSIIYTEGEKIRTGFEIKFLALSLYTHKFYILRNQYMKGDTTESDQKHTSSTYYLHM